MSNLRDRIMEHVSVFEKVGKPASAEFLREINERMEELEASADICLREQSLHLSATLEDLRKENARLKKYDSESKHQIHTLRFADQGDGIAASRPGRYGVDANGPHQEPMLRWSGMTWARILDFLICLFALAVITQQISDWISRIRKR